MPASVAANEPSGDKARTAYGYIRMEKPDEIEIALQRKEIGIRGTATQLFIVYGNEER